jgi:hypothetical protein
MIQAWSYLGEQDFAAFRATVAFLNKRLAEQATIDWALRLNLDQRIERLAIENLLSGPDGHALVEPWATAWRMIEESWSAPAITEEPSIAIYRIQERLRVGNRSGVIISQIVSLVAPRLKVEPLDSWRWKDTKKPRHPKTFDDLLSAKLTSGKLVDLDSLGLAALNDIAFLKALASGLEFAVNDGLEVARRLGWSGRMGFWKLGGLNRVSHQGSGSDADSYHYGIAPSVKLLYAVVDRIAGISAQEALPFVQRWRSAQSPVHTRLWAVAARNPELVTPEQVSEFLSNLPHPHFWDVSGFPEVMELRALRFSDLDPQAQKTIAKLIRKGPPRTYWLKKAEAAKVKESQTYRAVRELKRIEVAGGVLPSDERVWMDANIRRFTDLDAMNVDEGLPATTPMIYDVSPNPDVKYDALDGIARLRELEIALSSSRDSWNDDAAGSANDWFQQPEKALLVLCDLEAAENGGDEFPHVWKRFGWAHSPRVQDASGTPRRDLQAEANRVLALLNQLSEATLSAAIEGISDWLHAWGKQVIVASQGLPVWLRIWPIAVEATNSMSENADDVDLSVIARSSEDDNDPMELDTLNTPSGKLTGVFLSACPSLKEMPNPFDADISARHMRDAVIGTLGRSGLIVRHRLIEHLPYFLEADREWTQQHLVAPLLKDDAASLDLWRAIAHRTHYSEGLETIGSAMVERATDRRLGRETRQKLVFSLVIESLYAFRENRKPAVPHLHIQQMLRSVDDEVRAFAANTIQQFIRDLSVNKSGAIKAPSAADLFRSAAAPFLQDVWPQERSLATPGVSGGLADIPATTGDAFVEAVGAIERFLVPFKCWSMHEYGFYGEESGETKFAVINSESKAEALLRLLNLTIGTSEGAVIPYDLTAALDQIRSIAPELTKDPIYRRLSTTARR